jgi:hypothetical protein
MLGIEYDKLDALIKSIHPCSIKSQDIESNLSLFLLLKFYWIKNYFAMQPCSSVSLGRGGEQKEVLRCYDAIYDAAKGRNRPLALLPLTHVLLQDSTGYFMQKQVQCGVCSYSAIWGSVHAWAVHCGMLYSETQPDMLSNDLASPLCKRRET